MAVTQISRIQIRRGLQQDLPQLASAELGWSVDTRKLYIGNGTVEEGAPSIGLTEILTEQSDLSSLLTTYTFAGDAAGYTVQTGSSVLNPVTRSYQAKLDDFVNVRDFGAKGDGITDDTLAINRALQQIYRSDLISTQVAARRTIYFPGGTYVISDSIKIPTFAKLIGDGLKSTIIKLNQGNKTLAYLSDSKFQIDSYLGSNSAILPDSITISDMQFWNSNVQTTANILNINSASNIKITGVHLRANSSTGFYSNIITISSSVGTTKNILLDSCIISDAGNGMSIIGNSVSTVRTTNTLFSNLSNVGIDFGTSTDLTSINNIFENAGTIINRAAATGWLTFADSVGSTPQRGIYLGNLQIGTARSFTVSTTPTVITSFLANSAAEFTYEISNSSARRFGTFSYTNSNGSSTLFTDNYNETAVSFDANMYANNDSIICSISSGTAITNFNIKQYI
jgi:hypothetical protein